MDYQNDTKYALLLDKEDELKEFRRMFFIPDKHGKPSIYMCGNSLGLQPKSAKFYIEQEMRDWREMGVEGHLDAKNPWLHYHTLFPTEANLVGALPSEVVLMNTLTVNLHLLMVSFYRPKGKRTKILMEAGAFSSDQYAVESQINFHGLDYGKDVIEVAPRKGEYLIREEDILQAIDENKKELALVLLGGVNYYTGQYFNLEAITKAGHQAGAVVGFDLAHAVGNVLLQLHDWNVDFAAWCTYKYLNSGPGGVGGVFVHERHGNDASLPRFAGWWGHDEKERFKMQKGFKPMVGAAGWQVSNAQVISMAVHKASLDIFDEAGFDRLREKSVKLTGYLEFLIKGNPKFKIITPSDPQRRGCQLSLLVKKDGKALFDKLDREGIIADWREPNVIRISPVPLYNTFSEVHRVAEVLNS
ncbi:MAG: kynureninase [Chitinophagales bacterium]|nr:kynureninase [Chitinophagales bacterium]